MWVQIDQSTDGKNTTTTFAADVKMGVIIRTRYFQKDGSQITESSVFVPGLRLKEGSLEIQEGYGQIPEQLSNHPSSP